MTTNNFRFLFNTTLFNTTAKILTQNSVIALVVTTLLAAGCSFTNTSKQETCTNRTYLRTPLRQYLTTRYPTNAPVRMGIIPFSSAENISSQGREFPGFGIEYASRFKNELLAEGAIPIVEIMDRRDWPGKRDEFHAGNFSSLDMARSAGYDLMMVGLVEFLTSLDTYSVQTKIVEVESGMTIWSGKNTVHTNRNERERSWPMPYFIDRRPDMLNKDLLIDEVVRCTIDSILNEERVPG